jgi:hypothetical protein
MDREGEVKDRDNNKQLSHSKPLDCYPRNREVFFGSNFSSFVNQ